MAKTHPAYPPAFRAEVLEPVCTSATDILRLGHEAGLSEQAATRLMVHPVPLSA